MEFARVTLEDKYTLQDGRIYLSGIQALVRLPMMQRARDRAAGLNTAGLISGYRGSPLGGYDNALWQARALLEAHDILFPAGPQRGPCRDRRMGYPAGRTVFRAPRSMACSASGTARGRASIARPTLCKHANWAGTSPQGRRARGCRRRSRGQSSTTAHQSEQTFESGMCRCLSELRSGDLKHRTAGICAVAILRMRVGFKMVSETVEGTVSSPATRSVPRFVQPPVEEPPGGVHIRPEVLAVDGRGQDRRLRRRSCHAYVLLRAPTASIASRSDRRSTAFRHCDRREGVRGCSAALRDMGIDDETAAAAGIGVYKIGLVFRLDSVALIGPRGCCGDPLRRGEEGGCGDSGA